VALRPPPAANDGTRHAFLVAHRAGNRLVDLHAAERIGQTLIEADIRLFRGGLDVRHSKSVGPLPVLWDDWSVSVRRSHCLRLHDVLYATAERTEVMLDLKGRNMRVAHRVLEALGPFVGARRLIVCSRYWPLLEPFAGVPVRRVWSVGTEGELRRLLDRHCTARVDGVSIHERLVDADSVVALRAVTDVIMTWTVNEPDRARELLRLGVDGLITDRVTAIRDEALSGSWAEGRP
jgi:glycerophosphoryl diester phosphodiesterase